jgi:hypothetical protein
MPTSLRAGNQAVRAHISLQFRRPVGKAAA